MNLQPHRTTLLVFMFPGHRTFNPYWDLLAAAISKAAPDVEVKKDALWRFRIRELFGARAIPRVIHVHWIKEYTPQSMGRLHVLKGYAALILYQLLITILKRFTGAKVVWTVHNADIEHLRPTWSRFFLRWTDTLADAYIFHCEASKRHFLAGKKPKTSFIIPHGNYIGHYGPILQDRRLAREMLGIPADATVFLVLGVIRASKNLETLLGNMHRMPHRNIRVVVAGQPITKRDWSLIYFYRRRDERFIFIPRFIQDPQMRWLLAASDYLLNAQIRGYVSGATVTALSYGLPVVSMEWACAPTLIQHRENGFLFNWDSFYLAIDAAIEMRYNSEAYDRMRRKAYETAERLSWDDISRETLMAYRTILR